MYVHIYLKHHGVHQKLAQSCKLNILRSKKKTDDEIKRETVILKTRINPTGLTSRTALQTPHFALLTY